MTPKEKAMNLFTFYYQGTKVNGHDIKNVLSDCIDRGLKEQAKEICNIKMDDVYDTEILTKKEIIQIAHVFVNLKEVIKLKFG